MNHTLSNGLELLLYLAQNPVSHQVNNLAKHFQLPASHIHRLLQTLMAHDYVEQSVDKKYRIGVGALRLGHAMIHQIPIRSFSLPLMHEFVKESKFAISLALPFKGDGIVVAHVSPDGVSRSALDSLGSVLPSYSSASGKLFLAFMEKEKQEEVISNINWVCKGPQTHQNKIALKKDLKEIYQNQFSVSHLENGANVVAIAAPIFSVDHKIVAAIGISANHTDFTETDKKQCKEKLLLLAEKIHFFIKEQ